MVHLALRSMRESRSFWSLFVRVYATLSRSLLQRQTSTGHEEGKWGERGDRAWRGQRGWESGKRVGWDGVRKRTRKTLILVPLWFGARSQKSPKSVSKKPPAPRSQRSEKSLGKGPQVLGTRWPFTGVSQPSGPENPEKVRKKSLRASAPGPPESLEKSRKSLFGCSSVAFQKLI